MNEDEQKKERRERRRNREFGGDETHGTYGTHGTNGGMRMLPASPDAEMGLLGSILLNPTAVFEVCEEHAIGGEHFHVPAHATIYHVLAGMHAEKRLIDQIVLTQALRDRDELDKVGGPAFITHLYCFVPTVTMAGYYAGIVVAKYTLRRIVTTCEGFAARGYEECEDVQQFCDEVQGAMLALTETRTTGNELRHIRDGVYMALDTVEKAYEHRGRVTGIATGFVQYDRMTNGLQPGEMTVIAGRPSMGKTALGVNIAENIALGIDDPKQAPMPVAIFSLEMSYQAIAQRIMWSQANVSLSKIQNGFMGEGDFQRLNATSPKVATAPIYIDETPALKILEFRARARRAVRKYGVRVIVIDYLGLMRGNIRRREENRQNEVAEISAGIKATAKELGIPIVVLAQLNRDVESRKGNQPKLSDLRESGAIEQDADVVGLLFREEYYLPKGQETPAELQGKAVLDIAKQRNGGVGPITLRFVKDVTRFENWDPNEKLFSNNNKHRQKSLIPGTEEECDGE